MSRESESGLTPAIIEYLRVHKGMNQNEIAKEFGVSRQYVSKLKHSVGTYTQSPREIALAHYPWETGNKFNEASPNRRLRDHAEYHLTYGEGMSLDKLKRLRSFYLKLINKNLVVEFDPTLPPEPGVSSVGGFAFRERKPSDGELLIRVNQYTRLTPEGEGIWRMPKVLPDV